MKFIICVGKVDIESLVKKIRINDENIKLSDHEDDVEHLVANIWKVKKILKIKYL